MNANKDLKDRGFINLTYENEGLISNVSLTLKGCDLGRKYSSKYSTFWVWCIEYKLWIILGLVIAFLTLVVTVLKD